MNYIFQFIVMMLTAVFMENIIFTRAIGTSWLLFLLNKPKKLLKYVLVLTGITTISGLISYPIRGFVSTGEYSYFLVPLTYIAVMAFVYIVIYIIIKKFFSEKFEKTEINLGAGVFNCAVLGGLLVPVGSRLDLISTLGFSVGSGIGFGLAVVIVGYGIKRLEYCKVPKAFKGVPIALIYLGLLSLAFYGLIGHQLAT